MVVAALTLSAAGLVGIVAWESYRGDAYLDSVGVPTIGFGTTDGVKMGDRISVPVALDRALKDTQKFEGALKRCVAVPLHQYEYDAYISFSYNVGASAFCASTLVRKLNEGDYASACAELSKWVYAGGQKLRGLVKRREQERALCEGRM